MTSNGFPQPRPDLLTQLQAYEQIFHHPEPGTSRGELERYLSPGFWRVGARGRVYDRDESLSVFMDRFEGPTVNLPWTVHDSEVQQVDRTTYLHTYRLEFTGRNTLRCTLWCNTGDGWLALYHQATEAVDA